MSPDEYVEATTLAEVGTTQAASVEEATARQAPTDAPTTVDTETSTVMDVTELATTTEDAQDAAETTTRQAVTEGSATEVSTTMAETTTGEEDTTTHEEPLETTTLSDNGRQFPEDTPVDCVWLPWTEWSECLCEEGIKIRMRNVAFKASNDGPCKEPATETQECQCDTTESAVPKETESTTTGFGDKISIDTTTIMADSDVTTTEKPIEETETTSTEQTDTTTLSQEVATEKPEESVTTDAEEAQTEKITTTSIAETTVTEKHQKPL